MKRLVSDPAAMKAITDLANEYDLTAAELEKYQQIRGRAHEIWIERGRPEGRDMEIWLAAELELEVRQARRRRA